MPARIAHKSGSSPPRASSTPSFSSRYTQSCRRVLPFAWRPWSPGPLLPGVAGCRCDAGGRDDALFDALYNGHVTYERDGDAHSPGGTL